ncbi:MAG: dual specificity protein phosphatase family protein [Kiritimatiellia bacterium]|nr:dual specificity protein phosphatase family protein [Kiritimatiellia bacterium]MDP6630687.1 dual specificity protein phosphatase family protein [Kiritimatiellia bacterium]MDP6809450.1 dual specificity protein phosphatase family protein [Kiritimatiellia bacterium]MDP7023873.1 dual specificity protein phosphatase family protein [Kiritimatiellia bacterium]
MDGVLIGRLLSESESEELIREGVGAVLDLTCEFSESAALRELQYRNCPILDLTAPTPSQLREAVDFMHGRIAEGDTVYVHCKVGYSRTATVVGAYLMAAGLCETVEDALGVLRSARPSIVVRPEALRALRQFHAETLERSLAIQRKKK